MKKLLLLLLWPLIGICQPMRIEIEVPSVSDQFNLIPSGRQGILVCYESRSTSNTPMWTFSRYDTLFKEVWKKEFPVLKNTSFLKYDLTDGIVSMLFGETGSSRSTNPEMKGDYQIIQIDLNNGLFRELSGKITGKVELSDFKSIGSFAMFGGRTVPSNTKVCLTTCYVYALGCIPLLFGAMDFKQTPVIITADMNDKKKLMLPVMVPGSGNVTGIGKDTINDRFDVTISNRPTRKTTRLFVRTVGKTGEQPSDLEVKPGNANELLKGKAVMIGTDKLIIGTYGSDPSDQGFFSQVRRAFRKKSSEIRPHGFYAVRFKEGMQGTVAYHSFPSLSSFTATQKVNQRGVRNENLLLHDVIESNGQYLLIAEAYYPQYHTEYQYTYIYGRPSMTPVDVFDGYRYTNAYILAFDSEGKLLWDNSFEMWDILSYQLTERVKVLVRENETALVYSYNSSIKSKVIAGSKVLDGKTETPIETSRKGDEVKAEYRSNIEYWYSNYFIAYGFQKIKNQAVEDKRRTVFYFNKISFK